MLLRWSVASLARPRSSPEVRDLQPRTRPRRIRLILAQDLLGRRSSSGLTNKIPSGNFHQFCHPWLRRDHRFAPLFAEDSRALDAASLCTDFFDPPLHGINHVVAAMAF